MSAKTQTIPMSDILSALSFALDLTEGQPIGHAVRSCLIGMKIGERAGLSSDERAHLFYALLLKDAGCTSNAARVYSIFGSDDRKTKRALRAIDWTSLPEMARFMAGRIGAGVRPLFRLLWRKNSAASESIYRLLNVALGRRDVMQAMMQARCERGAQIATRLGFPPAVSEAIFGLDEHWNGKGYPRRLRGEEIPLLSRIMCLAQTLEVFLSERGMDKALQVIQDRSGQWFDPEVVEVARSLCADGELDVLTAAEDVRAEVMALEPEDHRLFAEPDQVDEITRAIADVIDAKSPYTFAHSQGVMEAAERISDVLGLSAEDRTVVRRASLLHDIGKLSVPNTVLDNPGELTGEQWEAIRLHPYYTQRVLEKIATFEEVAFLASAHHERLDGSGYFRSLTEDEIPLKARIIAVADVYEALTAERPYRGALSNEQALRNLRDEAKNHRLSGECVEALAESLKRNPPNGDRHATASAP